MFKKALTILRWIFDAGLCKHLLFCFSYSFFLKESMSCVKTYCNVFGGFTLLAYPQTSHSNTTLPWFTFDRLQPCLTLTHSQPRSSLFNCLLSSLVHIHSRCSSSPSSSLLHGRSFLPCVGCGVASVCRDSVRERREGGLSSVFVVTAVQINSEEDAPRVCQLPSWLSFHPHTPSLFRAVTRGI